MANYANQKTIILNNQEYIAHKEKSGERFLKATDWKYLEAASRHLPRDSFKVYMYLLSWYGKGRVEFSPADLKNKWGVKTTSAREAINILIEKGYLELIENTSSTYNFYPISRTEV